MNTKKTQSGQSVFELLLAISVFTIGVSTIIYLTLDSNAIALRSTDRTHALLLAQEGLEATRSIRDADFENLVAGSYGLGIQNGQWTFQENPDTLGKFTRTISIINTSIGGNESGGSTGGINGGSINNGTIDVCVTAIDADKNQNTAFGYADSFNVVLRKPNNGASWTTTFYTPLIPTDDILSDAPGPDSVCVNNVALPYGRYSYTVESIVNGGSNWQTPKYNDQYTEAISTVDDFFTYNSNVDSDGLIDVLADRPNRTLVLLNQLTPAVTAFINNLAVKSVTSTVTWPITPTKTGSVQLVENFTNWNHPALTDSECFYVDISGADIEAIFSAVLSSIVRSGSRSLIFSICFENSSNISIATIDGTSFL